MQVIDNIEYIVLYKNKRINNSYKAICVIEGTLCGFI